MTICVFMDSFKTLLQHSQAIMIRTLPGTFSLVVMFLLGAVTQCPLEGANAEDGPPNVLMICVDDLRPELKCFGVSYILSPNIDRLAEGAVCFTSHYVQAPTCGASRFTLLTGRYGGASNGALFARSKRLSAGEDVPPSMPAWFRKHGYTTVSVGKVSHHPGGRGGKDWDDDSQPEMPESWDRHLLPAGEWEHPRGWMHGLAHGEIRKNAKDMDVLQALEGPDTIYPDGGSTDETLRQLKQLANEKKPFFLACGVLRPHLPFGAPKRYLEPYLNTQLPPIPHPTKPAGKTTWHGSGEFMKYNRWGRNPNEDAEFATLVRKHYAACVSFADAQVGRVLNELEALGIADNTVVMLWGDHGWHLGEHAIWGKHALFEESLRSPLIIAAPGKDNAGAKVDAIVETIDVFPTLCDLTGLPKPSFCQGDSLASHFVPQENGTPSELTSAAFSYSGAGRTIRTHDYRLIEHRKGFVELYDHSSTGETKNVAEERPEVVARLRARISDRLGPR